MLSARWSTPSLSIATCHQIRLPHTYSYISTRVATKIFKGFGEAIFKEFIIGREPASTGHYTRPGTCINRLLHQTWIQYQVAQPKLISYPTPCKLACRLPQTQLQNHGSSTSGPPPKSSKILCCNSVILIIGHPGQRQEDKITDKI